MKAVLFDMDGTLLGVDMYQVFLPGYMKRLGDFVAGRADTQYFIKQILAATDTMVTNEDPSMTNAEVFSRHFFGATGWKAEEWMPLFDQFYQEEFGKLQPLTKKEPYAAAAVNAVIDKGCDAVLATNPVFPLAAMQHRMRWGDFDKVPFRLITSYENMHACKPNPQYYLEILAKIGCQPGEAMMVGNDVEEDLVASSLGMKTFLVINEYTIQRHATRKFEPDYQGTLQDFVALIKEL